MHAGEIVDERFEIEGLAASGGMGAVYRARELETGQVVALKVVKSGGPDDAMRFAREALVLAELDHPGIVRYIAHGFTPMGESFLAMEWLEGEDLGARIERDGLTVAESLSLGKSVAAALAVLHERGVVHRDVKPTNLFLPEGSIHHVKLLDFGIAQQRGATGSATRRGALMGTLGYMSPERVRAAGVDARADVFSLGCVLFECLTGQPAFGATHMAALISKILFEEPPKVGDICDEVPEELEALVARMLSKDPAARPADGAAVAAELDELSIALSTPRSAPRSRLPSLSGEELCTAGVIATRCGSMIERPKLPREIALAVLPHKANIDAREGGIFLITLPGVDNAVDLAGQAARCALSLRAALPDAPMAMITGHAVLDGAPHGPAIERAFELLDETCERDITVDDVTARLLGDRFLVTASGHMSSLVCERRLSTEAAGERWPCVGREREIAALSALLEECVSEPRGRAVLVTGPAGVGKSRLRQAFLSSIRRKEGAGGLGAEPGLPGSAPIVNSAEIWIARGDPVRAGAPLGLAAQLLVHAAGISEGDPAAVRLAKLRARVARRVPKEHVPRVSGLLGEILGAELPTAGAAAVKDAHRRVEQVRRAFAEFLEAEVAAGPVLIILEDLHRGDRPSVTLIEAALRVLRESPFFVLALARPEVHDVFPRLWDEQGLQEMRLDELSRRASERLIRQVLGPTAAPAAMDRISALGVGNPLYLEELIRAEMAGKGDEVPETILLCVEARLADLLPDVRRVLRAGSVFGNVFYSGGVRALLGEATSAGAIESCLASLVDREMIRALAESALPGQEAFAFRQRLLREAAYSTFTPEDRVLGHRIAGDWLERAGEKDRTLIARHLERGGAGRRAAAVYFGAAAQALDADDFDAAIALAQRAAACAVEHDVIGEARRLQAEAHAWRGDVVETERYGLEAMDLLLRESPSWFTAAGCVATAAYRRGDRARLASVAGELCAGPVSDEVRPHQLAAMARLGQQLLDLGLGKQADALFRELESTREEARREPVVAGGISAAFAISAALGGDLSRALRSSEAAVARFEQGGDRRRAALERIRLAATRALSGAAPSAEAELGAALAVAERGRLAASAAWVKSRLALELARRGAIEQARAMVDEAIAFAMQRSSTVLEAEARASLGQLLLLSGQAGEAYRETRRALELCERLPRLRAVGLAVLARARLAEGLVGEALAAATAGRDLMVRLGGVMESEALVRLALAEALLASGDEVGAKRAVSEARERLLERSASIDDAAFRRRFLELPEHARTMAMWQRLMGGGSGG